MGCSWREHTMVLPPNFLVNRRPIPFVDIFPVRCHHEFVLNSPLRKLHCHRCTLVRLAIDVDSQTSLRFHRP